ncbi:MAG TPA: hypothetical protein VHT05_14060, partial [Candidatus Elarobacter sp.]|nr:hypothetical protein [Candidatus Elarobacter sp.]
MKNAITRSLTAAICIALPACSMQPVGSLPQARGIGPGTESTARATQYFANGIKNVFASAQNATLSEADFDSYIDKSVQGSDRIVARRLMRYMPANLRGDFVYVGSDGRLISNNPLLLSHAQLTLTPRTASSSITGRGPEGSREVSGYSSSCSPPDPPTNGHGPYVRLVSLCGFAAGWGFVYVTPGD